MSEKVTVAYHCDICDTLLWTGAPIPNKFTTVTLSIIQEQEWATDVLEAKHLCPDCVELTSEFVNMMRKRK